MWIAAPTPVTSTSMGLLNGSSVRSSGTRRTPAMSIQTNCAALGPEPGKTRQLHAKLISTASIEMVLLNVFHRCVNNVIATALSSGTTRISQGRNEFIGFCKLSKRREIIDADPSEQPDRIRPKASARPPSSGGQFPQVRSRFVLLPSLQVSQPRISNC